MREIACTSAMVTDSVKDTRRRGGVLSAAKVAAMLVTNSAAASPVCDMQLNVELTPDVPDPFASGFLSSLLSNQTGYRVYGRCLNGGQVAPRYRNFRLQRKEYGR